MKTSAQEAKGQQKPLEGQDIEIAGRMDCGEIGEELQRQILPYAKDKTLVVATPTVAAVTDSRSEWGSTGGIGYYSQVRVFCGSQNEMQEWQWRDRYNVSKDKPWLAVDHLGEVKVSEKDGKVIVEVELLNNHYPSRTATFTFNPSKAETVQMLSMEAQTAFVTTAENEIARIMDGLNRLWKAKPSQLPDYPDAGYVPYRQPSVKQREFRPEIGVAAFVTEEQIDHLGSDRQMRYELYVLTAGSGKAERKADDHGYGREGGAFLAILEVKPDRIVINTKRGKSTISLR